MRGSPKYRKPTSHELIEAYENIRIAALAINGGLELSAAEDEYTYRGSMNAVENFRNAIAEFDGLRIVGVPI